MLAPPSRVAGSGSGSFSVELDSVAVDVDGVPWLSLSPRTRLAKVRKVRVKRPWTAEEDQALIQVKTIQITTPKKNNKQTQTLTTSTKN